MIPLSVAWDDIGGLVDAHERFLAGARVDSDVRDPVLDSGKRCRSAGLEPHHLLSPYPPYPPYPPYAPYAPFAPDLTMEDPFLRAAAPVLARLTASLANVSMTIVLGSPFTSWAANTSPRASPRACAPVRNPLITTGQRAETHFSGLGAVSVSFA